MMGIEKQETKTIMFLAFVWLSQLLVATAVDGASIAINFADDDGAEAFSGGKLIGPTDIDSRYWNSSIDRDSGSLKAGAINNLIDNLGAQTTATVTWKASNTWRIDSGRTTSSSRSCHSAGVTLLFCLNFAVPVVIKSSTCWDKCQPAQLTHP
jgi:hypothetical protein